MIGDVSLSVPLIEMDVLVVGLWLLEKMDIPVYNFPGWMLIMMYATIYILIGRWWFKRSGCKPLVGYVYPLAVFVLALATMVSPLSQVLLWLAPFFSKGSNAEWVMLGFHLAFPTALLIVLWKGKIKYPLTFQGDLPIWVVTVLFHLADILGAIVGGYSEVIWLVVLSSLAHVALLVLVYLVSQKMTRPVSQPFVLGP